MQEQHCCGHGILVMPLILPELTDENRKQAVKIILFDVEIAPHI